MSINYTDLKQLFANICEIKKNVIQLKGKDLENCKKNFYNQKINKWQLNLLWEFIWDDKEYGEVKHVFESKHLI